MNSSRILIEVGRAQAGMTLFLQCNAVRVTWALMHSPVVVIITQMHASVVVYFLFFLLHCNVGVKTAFYNVKQREFLSPFKRT